MNLALSWDIKKIKRCSEENIVTHEMEKSREE